MLNNIEQLAYQYHKPKYAVWVYKNVCRGNFENNFTKVFNLKHYHKAKKLRKDVTLYAKVNDLIVDIQIVRKCNYYEYRICDFAYGYVGKYIDKGTIILCPID